MKTHLKSMNWPAFFFSCLFVVYGLWNMSSTWYIQYIMASFGLFVEWEAQQVWGLSYTYTKYTWQYWAYKTQYILYILIFALIPGTGFFMTEIKAQETIATKIVQIEANNQTRINQLNALIKQKTEQLAIEGKTTARTEYYKIQTKIDEYNDEIKGLMSQSKEEIKVEAKAQTKDMFANASKALWGIPKETLIFLMFGMGLSMVYTGLMRKPVEFETKPPAKPTPEPPNPEPEFYEDIPNKRRENLLSIPEDTEPEPNLDGIKISPEQNEFIDFIESWFGDTEQPHELPSVEKIDISDSKRRKFSDYLRDIGAIRKNQGLPCRSLWTKSRVIRHIENNYEVA
jgi:hypothetical protein